MNWADKVWKIEDVMVEDVVTVTPATPYRQLVELLWIHGISGLPVVDDAGTLLGIVSESDLLRKDETGEQTAAGLMTAPVVTTSPSSELSEAAATMRSQSLKRLPVVDTGGKLVGIVSRADLLKVFLRSGETLEWDVAELVRRYLGEGSEVRASVADGVVSLTGPVPAPEAAERLLSSVRGLSGVVSVEDRLVIAAPAAGVSGPT